MNLSVKHIIFLIVLMPALMFSQNKAEVDNSKTKKVSDIFSYQESVSNFLQLSQSGNQNRNRDVSNLQSNRNVTIIQQVGNENRALTNTVSGSSNIQYFQQGNTNTINSFNTTRNANERIMQNGVNNRINNFSFGNINSSNLNVIQNGNNLTFEKFGTNAQTNSLAFRVTGNNQSVIVRSF